MIYIQSAIIFEIELSCLLSIYLSISISIFVFPEFTKLSYFRTVYSVFMHTLPHTYSLHGIRARGLKSSAADKKSLRQNRVEVVLCFFSRKKKTVQ